jgi:hypothetical protein
VVARESEDVSDTNPGSDSDLEDDFDTDPDSDFAVEKRKSQPQGSGESQ